jgi:carboxyl-terminal processing protease
MELVAGVADPGLPAEASAKVGPASARPATTVGPALVAGPQFLKMTACRRAAAQPNLGAAGLVALAALLLLAGCVTPVSPAPRASPAGLSAARADLAEHNLRLFDSVWSTVDRKYYDPGFHGVDWRAAAMTYGPQATAAADETALYGAVNGMLELLNDSHTSAFTPAQTKDYYAQAREMTGFRLLRVDQRWVVDEVLPGSPAEAAGVQPGWIVVSRDGQPLGERIRLPLLHGGEVVHWEFLDNHDQPVALALTARRVSVARRDVRVLPGGFVFLRFDEFDWASMRWFSRQLKRHRDAPGVVVDLRQNAGGVLLALDFTIGEFFDHGFVYATSIDRSGRHRNLKALTLGSAHYRGRLAVLVDHLSASAAEIFAATMQEQHRGVVVGHKTAGDVLSARLRSLSDGGMLEFSDRDLRTAQGRRLEGNGVTPDVEGPKATLAEVRAGRDPDLAAALRSFQKP